MSLYSQNHYGQPSYTNTFTHPVPHSGYQYQYQQPLPPAPPPPPPVYQLDPISFRREYTNRLAELNVNSRPIIQNLSMLAQDYSRFAEIVAQCLEAHIRRVSHLSFITEARPSLSWGHTKILRPSHFDNICCPYSVYVVFRCTLSTKTSKMADRESPQRPSLIRSLVLQSFSSYFAVFGPYHSAVC